MFESISGPEHSQFKFTPEEREDVLKKLVPDDKMRENLSEEVIELLINAKEEEIREGQNEKKAA